jgi:hypothetical protein
MAIRGFLSPDKYSRTPDDEGRRIEVIDGGWRLLNYGKYRELRDAEAEKERKRNWAAKNRRKSPTVAQSSATCTQAEAEAEADKGVPPLPPLDIPERLRGGDFERVWGEWVVWRRGAKKCKDWRRLFQKQLDWLGQYPIGQAVEIMNTSMRQGWVGLFEGNQGLHGATQGQLNVTTQAILHQKELEVVLEKMRSIRNSYAEHQNWTQEDIDRFNELRARKQQLKQLLGMQE